MGAVQRRLPAVLVLDTPGQRTYPDRHRQYHDAEAGAQQHRHYRSCVFSDPAHHRHDHHRRSVFHALGRDQRAIGQRGGLAAVARQVADHHRIHLAAGAGHIRTDQAHCGDAGSHPGPARIAGKCSRGRGRASRRGDQERLIADAVAGGFWMAAFLIANMAPLMFASLVVVLLLGYPAAFSLGAVGLIYAFVGIQLGEFRPDFLQALPERVYGVMNNDTLLAIPFFTFMGLVLERSGMAEDLLDTIGQLFGTIKGGLAYAVVFVGALLAATTGVVAASVISMGLISLPIMLRYGYDRRMASGIIAASGTLAQIIPPSLVLIVMADQLGKSVGDMYEGAFVPGLVLAGLYALYTLGVTIIKPAWAPALPEEARTLREPDGSSGNRSLLVLTIVAAVSAVAFAHWKYGPDDPTDEMLVVSV